MIRSCAICGKEFDAKTRGKYCSPECGKQGTKTRDASRRGTDIIKDCPICGERFEIGKNGARTKYCSEECFKEYRRINNRDRWRAANPGWDKGTSKVCEHCGNSFIDKSNSKHARFCSNECAQAQYTREIRGFGSLEDRKKIWEQQKVETKKRKAKERAEKRKAKHRVIVCSECGKVVDVYMAHQKTCSPECRKARRNRLSWQRSDGRLNDTNIVDKDISLKTLYKRDKGACYICGGKCDFKDHTRDGSNFTSGPTYPSIDHIVPLARGGKHAWDNIKLAHHLCNAKKSDILPSELELDVEINDAYALARKVSPRKKQVKQFTRDGKLIAVYESTAEAERMTGFKQRGIQDCARGEAKSHRGYVWLY